MRTFVVFCLLFANPRRVFGEYNVNVNYFCRDFNYQRMVDINQLEGIWFLIEKINHAEERHRRINLTTCPVYYISEIRNSTTFRTYDTRYGAGYPQIPLNAQNHRNPMDPSSTFENEQDFIKQTEEYDRRTTYDYERRRNLNLHSLYANVHFGKKRLKILISDDDYSVEHLFWYNATNSGFWIHSGPREGVRDNIKHFSGVTQVLKAVGNHLVLTVCQSSRDVKELYTLILSRENFLKDTDIQMIHSRLIPESLATNYIERTCNDAASLQGIWYLIEKINHTGEVSLTTRTLSCPVIHISKHQDELGRVYVSRYPFGRTTQKKIQEIYDRQNITPNYLKEKHSIHIKQLYEMRHLRLYWDESPKSTEYQLRYGTDQPGFWSGVGFGTVQVIKAVGSHLALTFCRHEPKEKQLFTLVLSREDVLDHRDVKGVHNLLAYQGLRVKEIEKSCNEASLIYLNLNLLLVSMAFMKLLFN